MKLSTFLVCGAALLLMLMGATEVSAQEYGSYYQGRKVSYTPSTTQVLVQFTDPAALARRSQVPATLGAQAVQALAALPGVALLKMGSDQTPETIRQLMTSQERCCCFPSHKALGIVYLYSFPPSFSVGPRN